jgi:hypothetical protein
METNELIISRHNRHCLQCRSIAHNFSLHDIQKIEPMNNLKDRIIINISKGVENNSTKIKIG